MAEALTSSDIKDWTGDVRLSNAEAAELAALLATVARPNSPADQQAVELWVWRLSRVPLDHLHGRDLAV